jgi:monomeric sarcosine oxidase
VTKAHFDVIVLGGGTMGSAAAWALAKRGVSALVIEQFGHVHERGSHGGHTRIFRHAYSEGADYVPLMQRADQLWCELGEELGLDIVHRAGILEMDSPGTTHSHHARDAARKHGITYEWLNADEIRQRWPAFHPPGGWEGGYSDRAGFLDVEPALKCMAVLARRGGVQIIENAPVLDWGSGPSGCWVETVDARYSAGRLIVTGGSWTGQLLSDLQLPLTVVRKVVFWLDVEDPKPFLPGTFPVFAADTGTSEIYGFPIHGLPGMKVANHLGGQETTPDTVDRTADPSEAQDILDCTSYLLPGVSDRVIASVVCLYTRTPDEHFIIDRHPAHPEVIFAAGFSGHGFKFATVIGEHLADLALDPAAKPYDLFRLDRFAGRFG